MLNEKELIEYIREIRKVAGSQVGVHFGAKSPYYIREILRICEAAEQSVQADGLKRGAKNMASSPRRR